MPIYEYQCQSCQHELESLQKMSDPPLEVCPACAKPTLKKLISASAFRLKGSGWYETDFKTGSKKNGAGEDSSGKTESKPDSKPDNKSEKKADKNAGGKPDSKPKSDSSSSKSGSASGTG